GQAHDTPPAPRLPHRGAGRRGLSDTRAHSTAGGVIEDSMTASEGRRVVTVLFADLAGSTQLATQHDALGRRYAKAAVGVVEDLAGRRFPCGMSPLPARELRYRSGVRWRRGRRRERGSRGRGNRTEKSGEDVLPSLIPDEESPLDLVRCLAS